MQTGDICAVYKQVEGFNGEVNEEQVMRDMLDKRHYLLFKHYELATNILKGKLQAGLSERKEIKGRWLGAGTITKIIDSIDGNLFFHVNLFKWVTSGREELPNNPALEYTFKQYKVYLNSLGKLQREFNRLNISNDLDYQLLYSMGKRLLDFQLKFLILMWRGYEDSMPDILRFWLSKYTR